jgi:hypothetical protein
MSNFKKAYHDLFVKIDTDLFDIDGNGRVVTGDQRKEIMNLLHAVYDAVEGEGA